MEACTDGRADGRTNTRAHKRTHLPAVASNRSPVVASWYRKTWGGPVGTRRPLLRSAILPTFVKTSYTSGDRHQCGAQISVQCQQDAAARTLAGCPAPTAGSSTGPSRAKGHCWCSAFTRTSNSAYNILFWWRILSSSLRSPFMIAINLGKSSMLCNQGYLQFERWHGGKRESSGAGEEGVQGRRKMSGLRCWNTE